MSKAFLYVRYHLFGGCGVTAIPLEIFSSHTQVMGHLGSRTQPVRYAGQYNLLQPGAPYLPPNSQNVCSRSNYISLPLISIYFYGFPYYMDNLANFCSPMWFTGIAWSSRRTFYVCTSHV